MKILIIKTGRTETFDLVSNHPGVVSLGDVVRSTVLLHLFKDDSVTWLTSQAAYDLLNGIPEIEKVITAENNVSQYDLVLNLERSEEALALIGLCPLPKLAGFVTEDEFVNNSEKYNLKDWLMSQDIASMNWSQKLYWLMSAEWRDENYKLPKRILDQEKENLFDIGLNWKVGVKWPTKSWPVDRWSEIESRFSSDFKVSWQEGFDNLIHYMNWIYSCKVLVTHDSLGLHIARALNKDLIVLYGPTSSTDTPLGAKDIALSAKGMSGFDCLPCYKDQCHNKIHCMDPVSVDQVSKSLKSLLRWI